MCGEDTEQFNHFSGKYMRINEADIYFEDSGDTGKPILLVLHGGFESMENMSALSSFFSGSHRLIAIDSRGHGKSTMGNGILSYERLQKDVEAILNQLNIHEVDIIGFSDGGTTALRIASSGNIQVNRLIIIGASWCDKDVDDAKDIFAMVTPQSAKQMFEKNYQRYMSLNPKPDHDKLVNSLLHMWRDKTEAGHPNDAVRNITAKTFIIRGDGDFLVSPASHLMLQRCIDDAIFFNVPFAKHAVHQEQLQLTVPFIRQFMTT